MSCEVASMYALLSAIHYEKERSATTMRAAWNVAVVKSLAVKRL